MSEAACRVACKAAKRREKADVGPAHGPFPHISPLGPSVAAPSAIGLGDRGPMAAALSVGSEGGGE